MSRFQRHIFVCINEREPGHPKGCFQAKGSEEVRDRLKQELKNRGLSHAVRANNAGCLDACEYGVTMVIYPEGIWYGGVKEEDIEEVVDRTILNGEVIQRLVIPNGRYAPDTLQFGKLEL